MLCLGVPIPGHLQIAEEATVHIRMATSGKLPLLSDVVIRTRLCLIPQDSHFSSALPLNSLQAPLFLCGMGGHGQSHSSSVF